PPPAVIATSDRCNTIELPPETRRADHPALFRRFARCHLPHARRGHPSWGSVVVPELRRHRLYRCELFLRSLGLHPRVHLLRDGVVAPPLLAGALCQNLSRIRALAPAQRSILLFRCAQPGPSFLCLEQTASLGRLRPDRHASAVLGSTSRAHLELRLLEPLR